MKFLPIVAIAAVVAMPLMSAADVSAGRGAASQSRVVKIGMPGDLTYGYKNAPGQQVAQTYCLTCHSSAYVAMQPPMDASHWAKTVTKMRKAYGMQISDTQATTIVNYLAKAYGPKAP